jgi:hypothetical protein
MRCPIGWNAFFWINPFKTIVADVIGYCICNLAGCWRHGPFWRRTVTILARGRQLYGGTVTVGFFETGACLQAIFWDFDARYNSTEFISEPVAGKVKTVPELVPFYARL